MTLFPPIINIKEASSSNILAIEMAKKKQFIEGTIINVQNQTHGKGQGNHSWHSLASQNLTFSMIFFPEFLSFTNQFFLSKAISVAIAEYINTIVDGVSIKWPNDIYVHDKKIAGILIENSIYRNKINISIAGVGLNVNQTSFPKEILNPTSIAIETNKQFNTTLLLKKLQKKIFLWYLILKEEKYKKINDVYHKFLWGKGELCVFTKDNHSFQAKVLEVDAQGLLHLDINGNKKKYAVGEIFFDGKKSS